MIKAGQGLASGVDAHGAGARAAADAIRDLGGADDIDLALVFSTEQYDGQDVLAGVRAVVGSHAEIAGARVPGVLACDVVTHQGVGVLLLAGGSLRAHPDLAPDIDRGRDCGARAARAALDALNEWGSAAAGCASRGILAIPDAIQGNSCQVVRGISTVLGGAVRVIGGGSGDDLQFREAVQYAGSACGSGTVLSIALQAHAPIGMAVRHGCTPWGPPMIVTGAAGRVLEELDWVPAFDRYVAVTAALSHTVSPSGFVDFAMCHPLGLSDASDRYLLRSPLGLGPAGTIQCCSDVPLDAVMRVMRGDAASLLGAARDAGSSARIQLGAHEVAAAIIFACISRDSVVGGNDLRSKEIAALRDGLGTDAPVFGALTFGQIGSVEDGAPQFHSKSVAVCALPA